eukprot:TRINITY_DN14514_c0_g1_i1.p1 TRINITY_DN14514_c0_g1~~TRINITY_DN14514_c0_g1_i1.p1  ORF type:complete len:492 (-),score=69.29 TRINITY_DN14514_c0_g1_i1:258-1733(-)
MTMDLPWFGCSRCRHRALQASRIRLVAVAAAAFCIRSSDTKLAAQGFAHADQASGDPWDQPGLIQQQQMQQMQARRQQPLVIGGTEFSWDDDILNMEKLSNLFGQVFYTMVLNKGDRQAEEAWESLSTDIWRLAEIASTEAPSLALSVAMCLYNYFWWEGPNSLEPNVFAGFQAAQLMYGSILHVGCNNPQLGGMDFYILQCHLRWRYVMMLAGEVGRHLVEHRRDIVGGSRVLRQLQNYFSEFRRMPEAGLVQGASPYEVNFNFDYYPAAVTRFGPIWHNALQDVPVANFLEANYLTIRSELDAILAAGGTFAALDAHTRNAETQFGPRGDDWLTAYMFRKGEQIPEVCAHAPKTCALLQTRPEIANCRSGGSGAGFLRMRPGGRLKPHFGNAPRLSVHLGLIVPDGEIRMNVGYESVRWEEGKVLVFDDTYIHQVVHNGVEPRYVMNLWMCHPCDPQDGKSPGEAVPEYCHGMEGAMSKLGLQILPPRA